MKALYAARVDHQNPLSCLEFGDRPEPEPAAGWTTLQLVAASLNHHDIWSLRGVGLSTDRVPMILGCDAVGRDVAGDLFLVHPVIHRPPAPSVLSERVQGTFAEQLSVPTENLIALPAGLSAEHAACLPTAWLTAYRMLFTRAQLTAGQTVLVQGASGGLATALIMLAKNAGVRVWVTGRTAESRAFATTLGADDVFPVGTRLPELVDAVMDSVGAVTWQHSLKCLKPGGIMVVSGGTSGYDVNINIAVVFARQLRIEGSSMGTVDELQALATLCATEKISPPIEAILPLSEGRGGFAAMHDGTARGKIVFVP